MNTSLRWIFRTVQALLLLAGALALVVVAAQFTRLPWRAYQRLAEVPNASDLEPTHILVMGGSGIPGESGLMRTFYGAVAAGLHPEAEVLVAMPLGAELSPASRAYRDEIVRRGVLPERVRILPGGVNTREQALRLAEWLGEETPHAVVLIVSDPPHIRRTAYSLRRAGLRHVAALPAHALSIEDSPPWDPTEPHPYACSAPPTLEPTLAKTDATDRRAFLRLRYNLWNNLGYSTDALREHLALAAYRYSGRSAWPVADEHIGPSP